MPCSAYSQVGLISNKGGVGLFQVSQKDRLFHPFWQPSAYGGNLLMRPPFLHPRKKAFLSYLVWPTWDNTWTINWKESLLICFENCQGVPYSHRHNRNKITLPPHVRGSFEDKSMLVTPKRPFFSLQFDQKHNILRHSFERRAYWFVLKTTRVFPIRTQAE